MITPTLQEKLANLPEKPGCYIYKNLEGTIIYVGKAKNIRKRVQSYFSHTHTDDKTRILVQSIADIDLFITGNEVEALILENNLIKKHRPRFNIDLKDSKGYAYIQVTNELYPRLLTARTREREGHYYGPFVSGEIRELVLSTLRTTYKIRTCKKLPKKACLRYHIGLCSAPCIKNISLENYQKDVSAAEDYLKGKSIELIEQMKTDMLFASRERQYEHAKLLRDRIQGLQYLDQTQRFEKDKKFDEDVINYLVQNGIVYVIVFSAVKGILASKDAFSFEYHPSWFDEFITQYYSEHAVPKCIVLPHTFTDEAIHPYLEQLRDGKVSVIVPQKGERADLLEIVKRNIEATYLRETQEMESLQKELGLQNIPHVIECFDISNTQGTNSVGSMVQFRSGLPDKSNYRKFRIRTVIGSDDFSSIREVVLRRYSRLLRERTPLPDLVVIDGGPGQLHAALTALQEVGIRLPIIGLAKKFEEIYTPGRVRPIQLSKTCAGLKLLIKIRDEAHRFAITYHRLLRSKKMVEL